MKVLLLVITLIILIIVMTYINSGYSVHYFHILNIIFFLTFIVSMCGLIIENRERYVSIVLQKLYDAETDPDNAYKTMLCIETVLCLDKEALGSIDKRLSRLVSNPAFRRFWSARSGLYPPETQRFVAGIMSDGPLSHPPNMRL